MTPENQQIIRNTLLQCNINIALPENNNYFRITGNYGLADHVYFKIPKIKRFKLQLYFEGLNNLEVRDNFCNQFHELGYDCTPNNSTAETNYCFFYLGNIGGLSIENELEEITNRLLLWVQPIHVLLNP